GICGIVLVFDVANDNAKGNFRNKRGSHGRDSGENILLDNGLTCDKGGCFARFVDTGDNIIYTRLEVGLTFGRCLTELVRLKSHDSFSFLNCLEPYLSARASFAAMVSIAIGA